MRRNRFAVGLSADRPQGMKEAVSIEIILENPFASIAAAHRVTYSALVSNPELVARGAR